jgi:hypothetical protein
MRRPGRLTSQDVLAVVGGLCAVQGFGSALTQVFWGSGFGFAGLLHAAHAPHWSGLAIGAFGLALLTLAGLRRLARRRVR